MAKNGKSDSGGGRRSQSSGTKGKPATSQNQRSKAMRAKHAKRNAERKERAGVAKLAAVMASHERQ